MLYETRLTVVFNFTFWIKRLEIKASTENTIIIEKAAWIACK